MELVRRSYWTRVGFNTVTGVPVDRKYGPRNTGQTQCEDEAREWAILLHSKTVTDVRKSQEKSRDLDLTVL